MKRSNFTILSIILFVFLITGCSSLFGPSLSGNTHIKKALDGTTQIENSESADDELIQLFNNEYIKAYEEAQVLINEANEDVSKYLDMPYQDMANLATSYNNIKNKYGTLISSDVDFVALVKDIDKVAAQKLFDAALSLDQNTTDTKLIDTNVSYIKKAYKLDETLTQDGIKIINDYYILAGDIKVKSDVNNDLLYAISYYEKVLNTDKDNTEAQAKLKIALKKQTELKLSSINELIENGSTFSDYYKAEKLFNSLDSDLKEEYSNLGDIIEQKRNARVLFCVRDIDNVNLPSTKEFKPSWSMNKVESSPKKIIVDFISISNEYFDIPEKYNYVFIPDSNFGDVDYDYKTTSDNISVNLTNNAAEEALYKLTLQQDPNNKEALKALESGTYKETITTVSRKVNNIYHIYKVNNGSKEKIDSTSEDIDKKELKEIQYISGSKEAIVDKTDANFVNGNTWGERFNYSNIENYFKPISNKSLYNSYINNLESYFFLFE